MLRITVTRLLHSRYTAMAKVSWSSPPASEAPVRLQESLDSQSVSYQLFFYYLQTPELSILKADCFVDYAPFELWCLLESRKFSLQRNHWSLLDWKL